MDLATRWSNLFVGMSPASFFNFSFLPKYGVYFLQALGYTLLLAVISVLLAVIPALLLAFMRLSKNKFVRGISGAYIAIFRSTPLLVQLSIIYFGFFGAISIPRLYIFGFIDISRFIPGVVALALNSSAYVAEIFRAGILAVDAGQTEAARSLGLSATQAMKLVVLPQAIKNVLPALGNEVVTMVKESSICSTLGMVELMFAAKTVATSTYISLAPYVLAALMYAHRLPPRMDQRVIWGVEAGWAVLLGAFLQATGKVPLAWWIPCMAAAVGIQYLYLWVTRTISLLEAGYVCARAFVLAELAASAEWQLHCFLWPQRSGADGLSLLLLVVVYGGVFGCISFWECFGRSQFGAVLLGINPLYTFLVCVPTRILAGWLCGVAVKGLNKLDKTNLWSFGAAGLIGALCNTVLFMTTLCLCFYNTDYIQGFVAALGSANAFLFVIAFVGVNGLVEGAVCLITGAAIAKAVMYSRGKLAARKTAVQNGK